MTLTHDVTGRQLPPVTAPDPELGDGLLHTTRPRLPRLTMAAQKGWKNTGVLAGVADCGRSQRETHYDGIKVWTQDLVNQ